MNNNPPNNHKVCHGIIKIVMAFVVLGILLISHPAFCQLDSIKRYQEPGSYTFTVPVGVYEITVECWGGGGAGGGIKNKGGGGGGGGGAYASSVLNVTPGSTYQVDVAASKAGTVSAANNGDPSSFGTLVVADGGKGGGHVTNANGAGAGGEGGSLSSSTGKTRYAGGKGSSGSVGGAGGGGAGSSENGKDAIGGQGGASTDINGGQGANKPSSYGSGLNGSNYGGGGSGARHSENLIMSGGSGAQGLVIVSWKKPLAASAVATVNSNCIGNNSGNGTISVTATSGTPPYQYQINGGTPQASNIFTGLSAGTYTIVVNDSKGATASTTATVIDVAASTEDPLQAGTNSWIGHAYDGVNFTKYVGKFTEPETFDESFGGNTTCFNVIAGSESRSIYTETMSVKFRMNSTKKGLYVVDLGSDDGSRLTIDGTMVYNNWVDQSYTLKSNVLISLTGTSNLLYEYTENAVNNRVVFQSLTKILENTLTQNINQSICGEAPALPISGDEITILPTGISKSGTGYQWSYSTTPSGTRIDISGANSAIYTPNRSNAPFNIPGTYYIFRKVLLTSTNNVSPNPLTITNESNAAILTIGTSISTSIRASVVQASCQDVSDGEIKITNIPTALEFKSADMDYVDLGDKLMSNLQRFTIEGWVKINKAEIPTTQRTWGLFGQNDVIEFGIMSRTTLQLWTASGGGALDVDLSLYPDDNNWHHIAGVGDGTATKIYIDGKLVGSLPYTTSNYGLSTTYNTMIGGNVWDATGNYLNGSILKVGFWSRALSQAEIQSLVSEKFHEYYNYEFGLIAGYNFFEGTGGVLSRVGTATTNGTLIKSPEWKEAFTYSWTKDGYASFSASTKSISLVNAGDYTLKATLPGYCPIYGTWTVGSLKINQWTGLIDKDWNRIENWTCIVPKLTSDANIPSGLSRYPTLSVGATGTCKNLIIGSGASVTIDGNILQISGNIQNSGLINATTGTIEMRGSAAQAIPANSFSGNKLLNLITNNVNGVTLNGTLEISGYLKAQTGDFQTNGFLTLLSTSAGTALIDGSGAGNVLGTVTMQRYLPSAFGYKYFSSPFTNATVNEFADDIVLGATFPTIYRYEQNKVSTGWEKYVISSAPLAPGSGYSLNFGNLADPKTVTTKGIVNNGTVSLTLFNHNQEFTKGYNLVGNPYPSPIDWNAAGWTKTNIDNALYFFNAGTTDQYVGTYSTFINNISSDGKTSSIIAAQQGFFVHVSNGTFPVQGTLTFTNQVRVNNLNPLFFKNSATGHTSYIRISAKHEGSETADYMVVYFNDGMIQDFNPETDALKLMNTDPTVPNIYTRSRDDKDLSIDAINYPIDNTVSLPLVVSSAKKGTITLKATQIVDLPYGYFLYLKDNQTGKIQDLQSSPEYKFDAKEETLSERFTILLSKSKLTQEILGTKSFNAFIQDGVVHLTLSLKEEQVMVHVTDLMGRTVLQTSVYGEGDHKLGLLKATGVYIVSIYTDMGIISKKVYLK